jgi:very-short-patch-repair endonuclease
VTTRPHPGREVTAERSALVDRTRQAWSRKLIDLSRRNNLLFFRNLKRGTLELTEAEPPALAALLRGENVQVRRLLPREDVARLTANVAEIQKRALVNLEERGLDTLFVGLGIASWTQQDGGRPTESPVLLVPLRASTKGIERQNVALQRTGDVLVNQVLAFALKSQHGVDLKLDEVIRAVRDDDEGEDFDLEPAFEVVRRAACEVPGFSIAPRSVLGNFAFQKMAIVNDLQELKDALPAHDLIAALAGDGEAIQSIRTGRQSIDPRALDEVPPDQEFLILDADSSQQAVIANVLAGQHGVIQGPPGTGKSQTIANLIAELAARGKRVLFVAEKRAALEVVLERMKRSELGHLVLDLHGADVSRREVMAQVAESLTLIREAPVPAVDGLHSRYAERRARLVDHLRKLHSARMPAGASVFDLQGRRLRLPPGAEVATRWRGPDLEKLTQPAEQAAEDLLREAAGSPDLFLRRGSSPWATAELASADDVQQSLTLVARVLRDTLPALRDELRSLTAAVGLRNPGGLVEATRGVEVVEAVNALARRYTTDLWSEDVAAVARGLAPAERFLGAVLGFLTDGGFRAARRRMKQLCREKVAARAALADAREAARALAEWRALGGQVPAPAATVSRCRELLDSLVSDLSALSQRVPGVRVADPSFDGLEGVLRSLEADRASALALPRLRGIESELKALGIGPLLRELDQSGRDPARWAESLRFGWLESCLERAYLESPELGAFRGRSHDEVVAEFRALDQQRVSLAHQRVRRAHAEQAVAAMNAHPEQETLVRRESEKRSRHMPLRKLVQEAGDVLLRLRPCWMASPLSVSQLLPAREGLFDVVLFDEASQVLAEDAAVSLYRAKQSVVAGDKHQLPPTAFFAASEDELAEEAEALASEGFESLLDLMTAFCQPWTLDWHYRSRDESLIAFSNRHIYEDRLVTFPGPAGGSAVLSHVLVDGAPGADGQEDSVSAEVERVVELVLEHAEQRPSETLGVITMGIKHADRIDAALYKALQARPELQEFFDPSRQERFFVKNLERVQGDERDAILLSIGYGKDRSGRLPYRFGPLLVKGGERRLNVAVTRARRSLTLVSSFSHLDMEPGRSSARGVELLRAYLEYASTGGRRLGGDGAAPVASNPFEDDVHEALSRRGLSLRPQWGVSRYRIDLAAAHPRNPGQFVLAIECDGASYHSGATARDRDRLRQQHLEALGWRFHRIWSTDWFLRKAEEVERAVAAFEDAVRSADGNGKGRPAPVVLAPPREPAPSAASPARPARAPRPAVARRQAIDEYPAWEIDALVSWVASDDRLRTDDEWVDEMVGELGFQRRGKRIEAAIRESIARVRRRKAGHG